MHQNYEDAKDRYDSHSQQSFFLLWKACRANYLNMVLSWQVAIYHTYNYISIRSFFLQTGPQDFTQEATRVNFSQSVFIKCIDNWKKCLRQITVQSGVVITPFVMMTWYWFNTTETNAETGAEFKPEIVFTKDIPYLALTGELWSVCCDNLGENRPFYNSLRPSDAYMRQ